MQPCTCRGQSNSNNNSMHSVGWRGGSGCGRRRKPVPGGLAAASMPRTLPQPDPPRLRQIPASCRNGTLLWWVSTLVDTVEPRHAWMRFDFNSKYLILIEIHPRMAWIYPPSPGICRGWGGVGWQDRWRHGWRHRAPRVK
ncbi:conserved hypothetical protein [Stenotrophomonas maltophilia K279a]|uniref:Uncharacterized protein n=1 Tax=Stenotrophomonas maltophilia (strain K279a) TaxID=522373 RepID=B2FPX6_STRMK|nr:conserved hypothetical protein [Stenotrophomonas maltophilia K279a]